MIGRRGFIGTILAAFTAPKVPELKVGDTFTMAGRNVVNPFGLVFHRNAFRLHSDPPPPIEINRIESLEFRWSLDGMVPCESITLDELRKRYGVAKASQREIEIANEVDKKFLCGDRW